MAPSFSRSQRKEALKHVLENVLDEDPNGFIAKAISKWGGNTIDDLLAITEDDIKELDYDEEVEDPANSSKTIVTVRDLPKSRKARICLFQGCCMDKSQGYSSRTDPRGMAINYDPKI
jgi:hypothetical protein